MGNKLLSYSIASLAQFVFTPTLQTYAEIFIEHRIRRNLTEKSLFAHRLHRNSQNLHALCLCIPSGWAGTQSTAKSVKVWEFCVRINLLCKELFCTQTVTLFLYSVRIRGLHAQNIVMAAHTSPVENTIRDERSLNSQKADEEKKQGAHQIVALVRPCNDML